MTHTIHDLNNIPFPSEKAAQQFLLDPPPWFQTLEEILAHAGDQGTPIGNWTNNANNTHIKAPNAKKIQVNVRPRLKEVAIAVLSVEVSGERGGAPWLHMQPCCAVL